MVKLLRFLFLAVVLGLGFTLVACSSTSSPTPAEGDPSDPSDPTDPSDPSAPSLGLTQIGFFNLIETQLSNEISATAGFMQYDVALPTTLPDNPLAATVDTCDVYDSDDTQAPIPTPEGIDINVTSISAGDSLNLSSSAGLYATLEKQESFGFMLYNAQDLSDIPSALSLNIPGDVFPAFLSVSIPDISGFAMTNPSKGATITPTTNFTWEASNVAGATIQINFSTIDLTTLKAVSVTCSAKDDGAFSIPAATQTELGSGFSATGYTASRIVYNIQRKGNAILIVSSSSQQN